MFNRAVGTCADGVYGVSVESTDTAGNTSEVVQRIAERDTVRPNTPILNVTKVDGVTNGVVDPFKQTLDVTIGNGEQGATAYTTITDDTGSKRTITSLISANGTISLPNAWGDQLDCGQHTYNIAVRIVDRAGNASELATASVTTDDCPVCDSVGSGQFTVPIRDEFNYGGTFPKYGIRAGQQFAPLPHAGIDLSRTGTVNVYAAAPGEVIFVRDHLPNVSNRNLGWGNYVVIDHGAQADGNRLISLYAHLRPNANVEVGDQVNQNTVLGLMGTSGFSTGQHLHFQVELEGAPNLGGHVPTRRFRYTPVHPGLYLPEIDTNITDPTLSNYYCEPLDGIGSGSQESEDEKYPHGEPVDLETQVKPAMAEYIFNNYGPKTVLLNVDANNVEVEDPTLLGEVNSAAEVAAKLNVFDIGEDNIFLQRVGYVEDKNGQQIAYEGVLVANPWNITDNSGQKIFLVQNGIYEKYSNREVYFGSGVPIGIPTSDEIPVEPQYINNATRADRNQVWKQDFRYGQRRHNQILAYRFNNSTTLNTHYVVGRVSELYHRNGSQTSLGLPVEDTQSENEDIRYCKQRFENLRIDVCVDLNRSVSVMKRNRLWNTRDNIRNGVNPDIREVHFNLHSGNRYRYNGEQVYLIIHGWYANPDGDGSQNWQPAKQTYMNDVARVVKNNAPPNSTIIEIDWKEASGACCKPTGVKQAAEWIVPTSQVITSTLNRWGIEADKTTIIGHSLGTLLGAEISTRLGIVDTGILLEPPSQWTNDCDHWWQNADCVTPIWGYNINGNSNVDYIPNNSNYYRNKFVNSRAYVGNASVAGNHPLSRTAHQNYVLDFEQIIEQPIGAQHFWVVDSWKNMIDSGPLSNKLNNNLLDLYDRTTSPTEGNVGYGFEGVIRSSADGGLLSSPGKEWVQYLRTVDGSGKSKIIGTVQANQLNSDDQSRPAEIYGGEGGDTFYGFDLEYTSLVQAKDFKDSGDRISLHQEKIGITGSVVAKGQYYANSGNRTIERRTCNTSRECGEERYGNNYMNMKIEGDRNEIINQINLNEARNNGDTSVFTFR